MIEADAYLYFVLGFAVLVGWLVGFFLEYVCVGPVGYLFRIEVRLFFWACSVTNFYFFYFFFYSSKFVWHKNFEGVLIGLEVSFITRSMGATRRLRRAYLEWGCLRTLNYRNH